MKRQAELSILRGRCQIQNAMDLYNFGKNVLSTTQSEICKRCIFKYIRHIFHNNNMYYKPVDNNRYIHSVRVLSDGRLLLHALSYFSCYVCVNQNNYEGYSNYLKVGLSSIHSMERQIYHNTDQRDEQSEEVPVTPLKSLVSVGYVVAVFTDDSDFDYYLIILVELMYIVFVLFDWTRALSCVCF